MRGRMMRDPKRSMNFGQNYVLDSNANYISCEDYIESIPLDYNLQNEIVASGIHAKDVNCKCNE